MSDKDLWAEIIPTADGWRWQIKGEVPAEFRNYVRPCVPGPHGPGGTTATRWGARRQARKHLRQIRSFRAKQVEVVR